MNSCAKLQQPGALDDSSTLVRSTAVSRAAPYDGSAGDHDTIDATLTSTGMASRLPRARSVDGVAFEETEIPRLYLEI